MRLMLNITKDILGESDKPVTFNNIFKEIKAELKVAWKEKFPRKMMEEIEKRKIGELYTQLTLDGRFIMTSESHWTLTNKLKPTEIARARARLASSDEILIDDE